MKKLTGLIIILAALVLGGYYGMGVLTEKTIRSNIDVIEQSNGLHAKIEEYHKGLFSSKAKITWQVHFPERVITDKNGQVQTVSAQDYIMDMPLEIQHGPIIITDKQVRFGLGYAHSVSVFPTQYEAKFDAAFTKESIKPHFDLSIFVNYFIQSTIDFNIPAFSLFTKEDNARFDWLGLNAATTLSREMKKIMGTIVLDGLHFSKEEVKLDLGKVSSDYELHQTSSGLYLGDANCIMSTLGLFIKDQKMFELIDFEIKSDSDIEQHLFNTHFNITLKSLLTHGKNYGPGDLELALRNLDAEILAKINQQAAAMQNGTEADRQQAMIALLPELPKLFSKGTEFEISKLSLTIPEGLVDGSLFISLPKEDIASPFDIMQKIHGTAKLKVPAVALKERMKLSVMEQIEKQPDLQQALIQQLQGAEATATTLTTEQVAVMQVDKQLNAWQQNGLITVQGTDYYIEVTLDQGKFTVNGKPFDLSMLKF